MHVLNSNELAFVAGGETQDSETHHHHIDNFDINFTVGVKHGINVIGYSIGVTIGMPLAIIALPMKLIDTIISNGTGAFLREVLRG